MKLTACVEIKNHPVVVFIRRLY